MKTLRGNQLKPSVKAEVLRRFVYRNTVENPHRHIANSTLPPITDEQWLAITEFTVTKSGELDNKERHCMTWHSEIPEWKAIIDRSCGTQHPHRMTFLFSLPRHPEPIRVRATSVSDALRKLSISHPGTRPRLLGVAVLP